MVFDVAIIGAGISGVSVAHFLAKEGFSVAIFEEDATFGNASLAAGAFLSPLIGKPNRIKSFLNSSLKFALNFYSNLFPKSIIKSGLIRAPIDGNDLKLFESYDYSDIKTKIYQKGSFVFLKKDEFGSYFFEDAGIVEPDAILKGLSKDSKLFFNTKIDKLQKDGDYFLLNQYKAKKVVLALGAFLDGFELPYLDIRALCGERIEIFTKTKVPHNIHTTISISATKDNDKIVIGATHFACNRCSIPYISQSERLLLEAMEYIDLKDAKIIDRKFGQRACSSDFQPILGELIDINQTLKNQPKIRYGSKIDKEKIAYLKDVYIINGMGYRGFVYAPMCAKILSDYIVHNSEIPYELSVLRRFERWVKKSSSS